MIDKNVKIVKKHLKIFDEFDKDVFILYYRHKIFNYTSSWKEFPVYFTENEVLTDFIENAHVFNFRFDKIFDSSEYSHAKCVKHKKYTIILRCLEHLSKFNNNYYVYTISSFFNVCKGKLSEYGDTLGNVLKDISKVETPSLSDVIEEKYYTLMEQK